MNQIQPNASRVLFLDFDGVILHYRTLLASEHLGHSQAAPDPLLCALIRRVCALGVRLVISSSWREAEAICKAKLAEGDLLELLHTDWRTQNIGGDIGSRSKEIADWLSRHPEISDYMIADDDDFQWTPEQRAKWLECSPYDGMRAMDMKWLAEWAGVVRTKRKPRPKNNQK